MKPRKMFASHHRAASVEQQHRVPVVGLDAYLLRREKEGERETEVHLEVYLIFWWRERETEIHLEVYLIFGETLTLLALGLNLIVEREAKRVFMPTANSPGMPSPA
jgi:hypothetical protein